MSEITIDKYLCLMEERPKEFGDGKFKIIDNKQILMEYEKENKCNLGVIYESEYHIIIKELVCDNGICEYERILNRNTGSAVVIIPIYKDKFVLLNQFRHAIRDYQLCFPRGFGEKKLSSYENSKKEIKEELGCDILSNRMIGTIIADSGICGERVCVHLCEITQPQTMLNYEGIKNIQCVNKEELRLLINSGKITDGYTLSSACLYCAKSE